MECLLPDAGGVGVGIRAPAGQYVSRPGREEGEESTGESQEVRVKR